MTQPNPTNTESSELCQDCGVENPVWFSPNALWNKVMGTDKPMIVCPVCFIKRAEAKGVKPTGWLLQEESALPSPSNNLPEMICGSDGFTCKTYKEMEAHFKAEHSSDTAEELPHPGDASNNLKERVREILRPDRTDYFVNKTTDQILNLILDTILARPEMQEWHIPPDTAPQQAHNREVKNETIYTIRAMLEGMRNG